MEESLADLLNKFKEEREIDRQAAIEREEILKALVKIEASKLTALEIDKQRELKRLAEEREIIRQKELKLLGEVEALNAEHLARKAKLDI